MKTCKKMLVILLALAMVLSMTSTVFAAVDPIATDGTITVRNATKGQEYKAYKLFDLTYAEEVQYDVNGKAITPVAYSFTKTEDNAALFAKLDSKTNADSPFVLTPTQTDNLFSVTLKEGAKDADVIAFLKTLTAAELGTAIKPTSGADTDCVATADEVKFTGLTHGYYFVTSGLGAEVTIDSTMKDVVIVDKNEQPTIPEEPEEDPNGPDPEDPNNPTDPEHPSPYKVYPGKQIVVPGGLSDENNANYGDYVHFGYSLEATAYADPASENTATDNYSEGNAKNIEQNKTGLVTYYYVKDVMGQGFDLVKGDKEDASGKVVATKIVVRVIKDDENKTIVPLTEGTDYTVRYSVDSADGYENEAFQIAIPWGEKYGSNATITVDYYAQVTEKAVIAANGNKNVANFSYDTDPNFNPDDDPTDPKTPMKENPEYDPTLPKEVTNPEYNPYSDPDNDLYNPDDEHYDPTKDPSAPEGEGYEVPDPTIPNPDPKSQKYIPDDTPDENPPYDPTKPGDENNPKYPDPSVSTDPKDPFDEEDTEHNPPYAPSNERDTQTFVYAVALVKVDEDGAAIATAKFKLQKKVMVPAETEGDPDVETWVDVPVKTLAKDAANTADPDGVYAFDSAATASADNTELVTPEEGDVKAEIVVKGLAEGDYRFVEYQAPKGYNLPKDPFPVTIVDDAKSNYSETTKDYASKNTAVIQLAEGEKLPNGADPQPASVTVDELAQGQFVQNLNGVELPATGGIGTKIFYIAGSILLVGAAILLITKKRMSAE